MKIKIGGVPQMSIPNTLKFTAGDPAPCVNLHIGEWDVRVVAHCDGQKPEAGETAILSDDYKPLTSNKANKVAVVAIKVKAIEGERIKGEKKPASLSHKPALASRAKADELLGRQSPPERLERVSAHGARLRPGTRRPKPVFRVDHQLVNFDGNKPSTRPSPKPLNEVGREIRNLS